MRLKNPPYATRIQEDETQLIALIGWPPKGQLPRENAFVIPTDQDVAALNLGICRDRHVFVAPGNTDTSIDDDMVSTVCMAIVAVGAASVVAYNGARLCAEWWRVTPPWLGRDGL